MPRYLLPVVGLMGRSAPGSPAAQGLCQGAVPSFNFSISFSATFSWKSFLASIAASLVQVRQGGGQVVAASRGIGLA